jgi:hypothetical protein
MYLGLAIGYLLNPFYQAENLEIYWSLFLVCILTMVLTSVLNIIFVSKLDAERFEHQMQASPSQPATEQRDASLGV